MSLPKSIINHCKKHGIAYESEGFDCWEFIAPAGMVFANDGKYRILEDISDYPVSDARSSLNLFEKEARQ